MNWHCPLAGLINVGPQEPPRASVACCEGARRLWGPLIDYVDKPLDHVLYSQWDLAGASRATPKNTFLREVE